MDIRSHQTHPRSTVWAENGMAVSSHPAASLAAVDVLREGGSAMDAAIAAHLVLGVVEPMSTGIGGDAFCLYSAAGAADPVAFNGSGRAPAGLSVDYLLDRGVTTIEPDSAHSVTVPGAVDAFLRLHEGFGRLEPHRVFAPAVRHAEEGFAVAPVVARLWGLIESRLRQKPEAVQAFLPDGVVPRAGDRIRLPALAASLREIARRGRDAFYQGWIAEDIVSTLGAYGGSHALSDFASHAGEFVEPISSEFAGSRVFECPPNGQGMIALLMLNILDGFDLRSMDPLGTERLHLTLEAGRLAFRDRAAYLADPARVDVPSGQLLSATYASRLRASISPEAAMTELPLSDLPKHRDTVYACVVDRDRNTASLISSLYHGFGSCIVAPKSGVTLHCRGTAFNVDASHPNGVAPNKRPMHTIIPGLLMRDGRATIPFGVMGGDYQPWGHVHVLQNLLLYGMEPQQALDLPRFTHDGNLALVEEGIPATVCRDLARLGHTVALAPEPLGGGQLIQIDWERGVLAGGTEPRKDGIALGY